ncbi:MAG: transcriptional repressor [Roseiflexus castenholzii]|nr:MAG: transcriptional repressor [Roseiflexus castenholzii]
MRTQSVPRRSDNSIVTVSAVDWEHQVLAACRIEHIRLTKPRRAIIAWIAGQQTLFSTEALAAAVATLPERVGRATAYRMVEQLRETGWLSPIRTERGSYAYARTLPGHHHHAICLRCGATLIIEGCAALETLYALLETHGFAVQSHVLELTGRCRRCRVAHEGRASGA